MSVLATDNFNRANAGLGANWSTQTGSNIYEIISNQATNNGTGICAQRYTGTTAPANQYAKCTMKTLKAVSDEGPGPAVRLASGAQTMYFAQANTVEIRMYKVVAGVFTQLGSDAAAAAVNDVIEIDANGTSISVKKNGSTIIGPVTDSAIASGDWGIFSGGGAVGDHALDDWEGGDFTGAGGSPKRLMLLGCCDLAGLLPILPAWWRWRRMSERFKQ